MPKYSLYLREPTEDNSEIAYKAIDTVDAPSRRKAVLSFENRHILRPYMETEQVTNALGGVVLQPRMNPGLYGRWMVSKRS